MLCVSLQFARANAPPKLAADLIVRPTTPFRGRSFAHPPTERLNRGADPHATSMPHRSAKALVSVAALPFFAI